MLTHQHRGDGPNVTILLHGFLGTGRNLSSLARRWAERDPSRTLVMADMTGHGTSPPLPDPPGLEAIARDVLALADSAVGDEQVAVVGHSMGGRVALQARLLAPERVSSVAILDISPGPIEPRVGSLEPVLDALLSAPDRAGSRDEMRQTLTGSGLSRPLADWLLMNLMSDDRGGLTWRFDRQALRALYFNSRDNDFWDAVSLGPTVAVRGGGSAFVSDEELARLEELGASVHTLPGAGHFLHVDAQEALLDVLVDTRL